jgi:outer membrane protease
MSLNFCTKVGWKIRKIGYAPKAAARLARGCQFLMAFACGLLGQYSIASWEMSGTITGAGQIRADARAGLLLSADSALRR